MNEVLIFTPFDELSVVGDQRWQEEGARYYRLIADDPQKKYLEGG